MSNNTENIYALYTEEQIETIHMGDMFTLFYALLGQALIDGMGIEGESVLREATRRYGRDRGEGRRKKQLDANVKINMKSLFSIGSDLPADPRFKGEALKLTDEERNHRTLRCPMAELWIKEGYQRVGRIYCEEFHPACYGAYAFGYTKVGLSRTLTQHGYGCCSFNIILRAANLPKELKPVCFKEYDPYYTGQAYDIPRANGKDGFSAMCVKIYYYIKEVLFERFGNDESSLAPLKKALHAFAVYCAGELEQYSAAMQRKLDNSFIDNHSPLSYSIEKRPVWRQYSKYGGIELIESEFYARFNGLIKALV
ncbi:MAG: L-2-amino-thiazoline-4-carboxylic acid hydrolase [Eubacteriales bacterium]|nr:L-2-amino-thiazoline-4-carboxylic acid hydrolase [Eubacteriales bacterium]